MSKARELIRICEADPSLQPPKKWFEKMTKEIKAANPSYSDEQISKTIGDIWYNQLDDAKREEIRAREGKEYGPAGETFDKGVKAFSLYVNKVIYGSFKTKAEAEKVKKEITDEGDKLDKFEIKEVDFVGKLPWYNEKHPMFK